MYGGTFNDPKKTTWQKRHGYEQEFGDTWGLPAQNNFPLVLPKHRLPHLTVEEVSSYNGFQTLRVENVNDSF